MRNHLRRVLPLLAVLTVVICMMTTTVFAADEAEAAGPAMYGTFWALVPPIVAIVLALITK